MALITDIQMPALDEPVKQEKFILINCEGTDLCKQINEDFKRSGLVVEKIERLKNYNCWMKYNNAKESILGRLPQDPNFQLNEKFLYHGTSMEKRILCEEGFDVNLAREGCFGKGIYFSDTPKKCMKYAKTVILLARVILGDTKTYPDGHKNLKLLREPQKTGSYNGWRFHDSVKGRPRNYTEYVVYRNEKALIEYVVTFTRQKNEEVAEQQSEKATSKQTEDDKYDTDSDSDSSSSTYHDCSDAASITSSTSDEENEDDNEENEDDNKDETASDTDDEEECNDDTTVTEVDCDGPCYKAIPWFILPKGKLSHKKKKKEFNRVTGETSDEEAGSLLKKTNGNLERALFLYYAYKQEREKKARQEAGETIEEEEIKNDGTPIFTQMEPLYGSADWKKLGNDVQRTKMDKVVEQFLDITSLNKNCHKLAKKYVTKAKYDIDMAVINYYSLDFP